MAAAAAGTAGPAAAGAAAGAAGSRDAYSGPIPPGATVKDYQVIYPQYVDQKLTYRQGRRVSRSLACENPSALDIFQVCKQLGFHCIFQPNKGFPRDPVAHRGRVKVIIKHPLSEHYVKKSDFDQRTRGVYNEEISTKSELLRRLCPVLQRLTADGAAAASAAAADAAAKKDKKKKKK
eukprot:TRINITY_DN17244_c1_g1_i1.p1 TRINITY_DN17244_c1_g1~~TRINITY_DN17244_c1_g1_i1.p1  ORF type:complete len:206 (+),score=48.70 TRINITY_DN17244_c1_g1_i1:85-618(+)